MQLEKYYRIFRNLGPSKKLVEMAYFVTAKCNFRCRHCFNWREFDSQDALNDLNQDELLKFAKSLPNLTRLLLTGGEPFLRKDLDKICHIFYKYCNVKHISIPTNASLPFVTAEMAEKILKNCPGIYLNVSPSLDCLGSKRDDFVNFKNSFEIFKKVYYELMALSKRYSNFCINVVTTFNAENQKEIEEIFNYVTGELQPHSYAVNLVRGIMKDGKKQKYLDIDKYRKIIQQVYAYNTRVKAMGFSGVKFFLELRRALRDMVIDTFVNDRYCIPCYSGKVRIVMSSEGDVFPCETFMFDNSKRCFGNIRDFEYNIKTMMESSSAKDIIDYISDSKCFCHSECDYLYNILFNRKLFFRIMKKAYFK